MKSPLHYSPTADRFALLTTLPIVTIFILNTMPHSQPSHSRSVWANPYAAVTSGRPNFPRTKSLITDIHIAGDQAPEDHRHCPVTFSGTPQQMRCQHSPWHSARLLDEKKTLKPQVNSD